MVLGYGSWLWFLVMVLGVVMAPFSFNSTLQKSRKSILLAHSPRSANTVPTLFTRQTARNSLLQSLFAPV
jgi:hypothetical protein